MTLRETLTDWCDWDDAAQAYGLALGVFDGATTQRQVNQVVLSDVPLGAGLHAGMMALVEAGVVERREEPDEQFRWIFGTITDVVGAPSPMNLSMAPDLPTLPGVQGATEVAPDADVAEGPAEPEAPAPEGRRWWQRR